MLPFMRIVLSLASAIAGATTFSSDLSTATQIHRLTTLDYSRRLSFCVTGLVTCVSSIDGQDHYCLLDAKNGRLALWYVDADTRPGQLVEATGYTKLDPFASDPVLVTTNLVRLGTGTIPPTPLLSLADIRLGAGDFRKIRIRGSITELHEDEIDRRWFPGVLNMDGRPFPFAIPAKLFACQRPDDLIDATVEMEGNCTPFGQGSRKFLGRNMIVTEPIRILKPAPSDPFSVPDLEDSERTDPEHICIMRKRKVRGFVLARWGRDMLLVRRPNGGTVRIQAYRPAALPPPSTEIEAVGFPETDLYNLSLSRASIRMVCNRRSAVPRDAAPSAISPNQILHHAATGRLDANYHGRTIRLRGIVRALPGSGDAAPSRLHLESDGILIPVDISATPEILAKVDIGSDIEATGVCILDTENWNPTRTFPIIRGLFLVPRSADDIRIIANPPWWTPRRFAIAFGIFIVILVAILIWNASLRILVERRSRQLIKSQAEKLESDFRIDERTRIASELHDYLAQNLTAMSYQLTAAKFARDQDPSASAHHLETACTMLNSSRTELRRCLWDLKSDALEEPTFERAIRRTLQQILDERTSLSLDFRLSRKAASDTTAHTILSIVRELVANAILHGKAKNIRISGGIRDGVLKVSVSDDGCGFDTSTRKGSEAGHFGLDGVRNRIERLGGHFGIRSTPGHGTEASIELPTAKQVNT